MLYWVSFGDDQATAPCSDQGYGQGWTQLTDEGKMHLSKKDANPPPLTALK